MLMPPLPRGGFVALKNDGKEGECKGAGRHYHLALAPRAMALAGMDEEGTQTDQICQPPTRPRTAAVQKPAARDNIEVREVAFSLGALGSRASLCTVYEEWPLEDGDLDTDEEEEEEEEEQRQMPTSRRSNRSTANATNPTSKSAASFLASILASLPPGTGWLCLTILLVSVHTSVLAWLLSPARTLNLPGSGFAPVSLLAAATLLALPPALYLHHKDLGRLGGIQAKEWFALALTTVLGPVFTSWFLLTGLQLTSVPVTSVLSRLDMAVILPLGSFFIPTPSAPSSMAQQQQQQQSQSLTRTNNNTRSSSSSRDSSSSSSDANTTTTTAAAKTNATWMGVNTLLLLLGAFIVGLTLDPHLEGGREGGMEGDADMEVYTGKTISTLPRADGCGALVAGAVCFALTQLLTKAYLQRVPVGVCVLSRLLLALPLLHALAHWQGGMAAMKSIYQPVIWQHMTWYAPLFVWGINYLWLKTLSTLASLPPSLPSLSPYRFLPLALALSLVLELMWSRLLLGSSMTLGGSVGAGIVMTASLSAWALRWAMGEGEEGEEGGVWREEERGFVCEGRGEVGEGEEMGEEEEEDGEGGKGDVEEGGEEERVTAAGRRRGGRAGGRKREGKGERMNVVDTSGVAPGREVTLRFRLV